MARAWLERKLAGGLPPEAVRAARRGAEGCEFLVREQGALVDTWWAEALLSKRLGLLEGVERVRLEVEARSAARVDLAPRSFSEWLTARGVRHVLETAARESNASEVSEARCELVRHFYDAVRPCGEAGAGGCHAHCRGVGGPRGAAAHRAAAAVSLQGRCDEGRDDGQATSLTRAVAGRHRRGAAGGAGRERAPGRRG
eukprot:scaffold127582_cov36-Phaeocystis_antarctica.AAC.1